MSQDRWVLSRRSGEVIEYRQGVREDRVPGQPILEPRDLSTVHSALKEIEQSFGWPPDLEWTGGADRFTLLQARPITTGSKKSDTREWYLTLRPAPVKLKRSGAISPTEAPRDSGTSRQTAPSAFDPYSTSTT